MNVTPSQFALLGKLLESGALRQRVISQNLANVNTPGYHRQDVSFEQKLARMLENQSGAGISGIEPTVYEVAGLPERADGNNVDIDIEMGQLNKNSLLYQTYSQVLASKLSMLRSAITGRQ